MNFDYHLEDYLKIIKIRDKNKQELKSCNQHLKSLEKILLMSYLQEKRIISDENLLKLLNKLEKKYLPNRKEFKTNF